MKHNIFLFNVTLLIYIANLTISDGQVSADNLPDGAIAGLSPGAAVYTVAFSPDGKLLASGGDDNAVILWNVADGSEHKAFIEHSKAVTSVAFSPDGKLLASTSLDGYVRLWHVSSEGRRTSLRHSGWVESVAFSPDGKILVSGGGDQEGSLTLWDVPQKRDIVTFSGHEGLVESVAFSPDGRGLASAARDNTIKLWDVAGQRMRKTLSGHSSVVHAVTFSPDGETLASSSRDNTIKLWKVSSGENLATYEIESSLYAYAEAIAFSPDGKLLASACVDYTIRLQNVVNHREAVTLTGHHGGVTSVAFSPDGRTLASGSRDRTVLLWDLSYFGFKPQIQDTIPPEIAIHSPMERNVKSTVREVLVEVNVTDDSRIADVWINGREPSVLEVGVFSGTVPLNHGENEIRITATDIHSNMGTHRFTIFREVHSQTDTNSIDSTPPEIVIHSPTSRPARVTTEQFTIEGSVIDDRGVTEVWVNDVKVEVLDIEAAVEIYLQTYPVYEALKEAEIIQIGAEYAPNFSDALTRLENSARDTIGGDALMKSHRQVIKRVKELSPEVIVTLNDVASATKSQFKMQKIGTLGGKVQLEPLTYRHNGLICQFSRDFIDAIQNQFKWHFVHRRRGFQRINFNENRTDQGKWYRLSGSCWENGDEITIRKTLRDLHTGEFLASSVVSFLNSQLREGVVCPPPNHKRFDKIRKPFSPRYVGSHSKNPDVITLEERIESQLSPVGGLEVDVWTDKGRDPVYYIRGETMKVFGRVNQPAYLRLLYVLADRKYTLLQDNYYVDLSRVNSDVEIGEFVCAPPFGAEILVVAARTEKFPSIQTYEENGYLFLVDQDPESAARAFRGEDMRGMKRIPESNGQQQPNFQHNEAQVVVVTQEN